MSDVTPAANGAAGNEGQFVVNLPLFYTSPLLLQAQEHAAYGMRPATDSRFAAAATAIPIVGQEFARVSRSYPIVFSIAEGAMPLAVTGLVPGQNLFVDAAGQWLADSYVPTYVRRYPYIGMSDGQGGPLMLCVDSACDRLSAAAVEDAADPFFGDDGKPTQLSLSAMTLCEAYAQHHERTRAFAAALVEHGLLVERDLRVNYPRDGAEASIHLDGFRLVDEDAFRALSGDVLATFHANGWLDLVALHLASQLSWRRLADLSASAAQQEAA